MGALIENAKLIIDDLKSSWYFRLWCLFWIVCTLTVFSSLIILGKRTTKDTEHPELHMWLENATSITFPRFHIRIHSIDDTGGQLFASKTCLHNKQMIQTSPCAPFRGTTPPPTNKCFSVSADSVTAQNVWGEFFTGDTFIECVITTTGSEPDGNNMLVWGEEDPNGDTFGGVNSRTAFIGPDADAWVVIEKEILETHHGEVNIWHKELVYHSSNFTRGNYRIATVLGSFRVPHFFMQNAYNAWMGLADVGGFAFFTIILHTIVMMFVGICLDNDSRFLKGGDSGHRPI